jgi:PKD repeat protein
MKKITLFLTMLLIVSITTAQNYDPNALDGRVIFKLKDSYPIDGINAVKPKGITTVNKKENLADYPQLAAILNSYNVTDFERPSYYTKNQRLIRIFTVDVANASDVDLIIRDLQNSPIVEYAEKQAIYETTFIPNDTYWDGFNNWYLTLVGAETAWDISLGDPNVKVAIVDNAVFVNHQDLVAFTQFDVADNDNDATPPLQYGSDQGWSHGTHCAGLATASVNNGVGIASLGANSELIGVKCTRDVSGSNAVEFGYQGVQWACENGANVVSMSYGGPSYNQSMQDLINAYPNVVFLAAAGNDNVTTMSYPGAYANVICVGSVDGDDSRSSFSNYNPSTGTQWVDICSPGGYTNGGLQSTVYTTSGAFYGKMGGTSMATPFAAGLAAAMKAVYPTITPAQIEAGLIASGVNVNQNMGPRIDATAALQYAQNLMDGNAVAHFFSPSPIVTVGNSTTFVDYSNDGGSPITNWQWTFNGGTPSTFTGQTPPPITYNTVGTYTVELTVTNANGSNTSTMTDYITVTLAPYGMWYEQATTFSQASTGVNYISIVDVNNVWITAYDGSGGGGNIQEFAKTTDGGNTWVSNTIDIASPGSGISMISAVDANTAYMVAYPNAAGDAQGIYITTDGGTTWTRQNSALFNDAAAFANVVYFWDANNGVCQGDPVSGEFEVYTTTDGGNTWVPVPGANLPDPLSGEYGYVRGIEVVGDNVWYTTNNGRLYHSTDKGYTWNVYQTPLTDFGGTAQSANISFKDAMNGIIIDNSSNVYKTSDAGANWTQITPSGTFFTGDVCWVEGSDTLYSTGQSGSAFSIDAGLTWNLIDTEQHTEVEFINSMVGWSGFFTASPTSKGIWKWGNVSNLVPDFIADDQTPCAGVNVQFTDLTTGGTPTAWEWTFPGGTPSTSTLQNPIVVYNTGGTYDVTLKAIDANGFNIETKVGFIVVTEIPAQPQNVTGPTTPIAGSSQTYAVSPPIANATSYTWTLPANWIGTSTTETINVTVGDPGNVSVYASNSCGNGQAFDLAVIPTTLVPDFIASDSTICAGDQITLTDLTTGSTPTSWAWDLPGGSPATSIDQNPVVTYPTAGTYNVTLIVYDATSSNTMTKTGYIVVNDVPGQPANLFGPPTPAFGSNQTYIISPAVAGATSYTWTLPTGWTGTSNTSSINVTVGNAGTISVYASNECGDGLPLEMDITIAGIGSYNKEAIKVFPNPVKDILTINLDNDYKNASYMIYDMTGKIVSNGNVLNNQTIINVNELAKGVYTLRLFIDGTNVNQKIVVE